MEIKESFHVIHKGISYVLLVDAENRYDLLTRNDDSLKSYKLAKKTAIEIIEALGKEKELAELQNHPNRQSPHTDKILKLLKEVLEYENK